MAPEPPGESLDLRRPRRIHVVAIGGAGMSAIATVASQAGHHVTGTDAAASARLAELGSSGIDVAVGHDATAVAGAEIVVASSAVPADNPELRAARTAGIPVLSRREVLAAMAVQQPLLSVSGTHGKTTTSSMLAVVLRGAGVAVSWLVGAHVPALGSAAGHDTGPWMVLEADESDGSFLAGPRAGAILTNLEADHLEYWGDWGSLRSAVADFVLGTDGPVVLCADDPGSSAFVDLGGGQATVVTYGTAGADYLISQLELSGGGASFRLATPTGEHPVSLAVPGRHNALNAAGAIALASELGVDPVGAIGALGSYSGVHRRFDRRGSARGVEVVDDYAHLPTEVAAALEAGAAAGPERLVVVFQPHRYSRTEALWSEFSSCFDAADVVVITDIFAAGEEPREGVSGRLVHDAVARRRAERGCSPPLWADTLEDAAQLLAGLLREGDLLMTVGAGDVRSVGDIVLEARRGPR